MPSRHTRDGILHSPILMIRGTQVILDQKQKQKKNGRISVSLFPIYPSFCMDDLQIAIYKITTRITTLDHSGPLSTYKRVHMRKFHDGILIR